MEKDLNLRLIRYYIHMLDMYTKQDYSPDKGTEELAKLKEILISSTVSEDDVVYIQAEKVINKFEKWRNNKNTILNIFEKENKSNDFFDVITRRRSIRFWKPVEIEEEKIIKIIKAGLYSPSAFDLMPWKFIAVRNQKINMVRGDSSNKSMIEKAPLKIYIAVDVRLQEEKYAPAINAAMAAENMLLALETMGLGGCFIYQAELISQKDFIDKYGLSENYYIFGLLVIGYPDEVPDEKTPFHPEDYYIIK